ncbi:unnamed protein product [Heterobilharzia americana]|nr:unnamed protein product [Heterobilharzia americana]
MFSRCIFKPRVMKLIFVLASCFQFMGNSHSPKKCISEESTMDSSVIFFLVTEYLESAKRNYLEKYNNPTNVKLNTI